MAIFGHSKFVPVFLRKIVGKQFKMAIFGHTKFIPVLLGNIVKKKLEHPFLAIPNLYQSFWEKLLEKKFGMAIFGHTKFIPVLLGNIVKKNWNIHFWPFLIYTSPSGKNCQKKIGTSIFHHSWFIPVLLGKILRKKLEQPFLAIPNLYQSSWEKLLEKNSEWPLLAIPNLYQSFWETLSEKDWNKHFWPFLIYTSLSGENCWEKFGTTIFGHSKLIPILLEKIVRKRLEQAFFAIPDLYQFFWEKFSEKIGITILAIPNLCQSIRENCWKKFRMAIFGHSKFIPVFLRNIVGK